MTTINNNPKVYVGTYAKYNNGNLFGEWVDLTQFETKDDFLSYCAELHKDEEDPELMFQDYECFPARYYSESSISDELWEFMEMAGDEDRAEALADYIENGSELSDFDEAYQGQFKDKEDFAYHIIEECYDLEKIMGNLSAYFDYEKFARDLFMGDYWMSANGHVFRSI